MSPSSWTGTGVGRPSVICRGSKGTGPGITGVREIVEASARLGIQALTLYVFSVENWKRPRAEVATLMMLLKRYLRLELGTLIDNNLRFLVIGRPEDLEPELQHRARWPRCGGPPGTRGCG